MIARISLFSSQRLLVLTVVLARHQLAHVAVLATDVVERQIFIVGEQV